MTERKQGKTLQVRQVKSAICTPPAHRDALRGLGLRRPNHVVERADTPAVRGLVAKIPHLVRIEGEARRER
jgi:large subunit ribosomal protein L30